MIRIAFGVNEVKRAAYTVSQLKTEVPSCVGLLELAQFTIKAIKSAKNGRLTLTGTFDHLRGIGKECSLGFLYISRRNSVYGELKTLNRRTREATFVGQVTRKELKVGLALPYVDRYFNPGQVARALEPASLWKKVKYRARDMVRYKEPAVPGWWISHTLDREISPNATEIHSVRHGWDHEHFDLCGRTIGRSRDSMATSRDRRTPGFARNATKDLLRGMT